MSSQLQNGGARPGAGRPKGSRARRDLEAIAEVRAKFPGWSPLLHLATVANDETLEIEVRLDAAKAAAPYFHAKLKSLDPRDPDAVLAFEERLAEIRSRVVAREMSLDGLGDRLARARARIAEQEQQERTDELACCRFRGHRDKVFNGTGELECREGSSAASSSLRR